MVTPDQVLHLTRDAAAVIVPSDLGPRDNLGSRFLFVGRIWEEKALWNCCRRLAGATR